MLISYRGVVKNGKVELSDAQLPDGTEVVVVTQSPLPSSAAQIKRLAALTDRDWQQPFEEYTRVLKENQAAANVATLSDTELNELVHEARQEPV